MGKFTMDAIDQHPRMVFVYLVTLLLSAFSAHADEISVQKFEQNGVVDFRINTCPFQAGLTIFHDEYSSSVPTMSDYCFDEDNGKLWSAEIIDGLELSIDGDSERLFEDFGSGSDRYSRNSLSIYSISDRNSVCTNFMSEPNYVEIAKNNPTSLNGTSRLLAYGYIYGETSTVPAQARYDTLRITMFGTMRVNSKPPSDTPNTNFHGEAFGGNLKFDAGSAEVELQGSNLGHGGENHGGVLKVEVNQDGHLTGRGYVSWENPRNRGHAENEWVSARGEFVGLRGHSVGTAAQNLKMRGWIRGEFTDINGIVRTFVSSVDFEACDSSNRS